MILQKDPLKPFGKSQNSLKDSKWIPTMGADTLKRVYS